MTGNKGLLSAGWGMVARNKRYIFWFWLLNLTLAEFGASAFRRSAHAILDHSLYADKLVHGFDASVFGELLARPEFGPLLAPQMAATYFAVVFFIFTALFLPGVFQGFASTYRLPREDFFRACGRNLWRFIRLMIVAFIVMGILTGILFAINGAIVNKADASTNELLPFELQVAGITVIFLIMTTLRIWFDLAEADVVLNDQRAVRKSLVAGFRHAFKSLFSLLGSYVLVTIIAAIILLGGIRVWMTMVPPESVIGAFIVAQIILLLLLIPRFWQRGIAVAYWEQKMLTPVVVPASVPAAVPPVPEPAPVPAIPSAPAGESV
ncbi:MAG TPA: hypothetical protein VMX38_00180 [Verrucomicrobiae bacterium]|jgi:hypothetical protein|nr:hypothetical protein [Verrucomicrobiae bacterium]